jgi:hypothetical protein
MSNYTTSKVASLTGFQTLEEAQSLRPVWLRIPAASRVSGLSRSRIFQEIVLGTISSRHIMKPGAKKGIRLVNYDSLLKFIEGQES